MPIYRGETIIENVERLPDGTSHLLLRIDDDNELIDTKNLNKVKGKYKYRFKRVGLITNDAIVNVPAKDQEKKVDDLSTTASEDLSESSDLSEKSKDIAQSAVDYAVETVKHVKEDKKSKQKSASMSEQTNSSGDDSMPSFNEKRKLFENSAANPPKTSDETKSLSQQVSSAIPPKNNKVLDLIKQLNQSTAPALTSSSLTTKNSSKKDTKTDKEDDDEEEEEVDEDCDEYNVANENMVTKLTKAKKKKTNLEKTVIIEESYVITTPVQATSASPQSNNINHDELTINTSNCF